MKVRHCRHYPRDNAGRVQIKMSFRAICGNVRGILRVCRCFEGSTAEIREIALDAVTASVHPASTVVSDGRTPMLQPTSSRLLSPPDFVPHCERASYLNGDARAWRQKRRVILRRRSCVDAAMAIQCVLLLALTAGALAGMSLSSSPLLHAASPVGHAQE